MPVVFAWRIGDVSFYLVSRDAALNTCSRSSLAGISQTECPILTRIKTYRELVQSAVGEGQCIAVNSNRYIFFGWAIWTRAFCQHPFPGVSAIERVLSPENRSGNGDTDYPGHKHRDRIP